MYVKEIKNDAKEFIGACDDVTLYNRITHAVEALANKGQWDSMTGYMDIIVQDNVITLPREVETPIKININNYPAFSRSNLYEFTLNGPGTDMADAQGWNWMDRSGTVAVMTQPHAPVNLTTLSNFDDNGRIIRIYGKDVNGLDIQDYLTINSSTPPVTVNVYTSVLRVDKDETMFKVDLKTSSGVLLSSYYPTEREPSYRQIRISQNAETVRILFRRNVFPIVSDDDFIPLQNPMAVLMMLYALETYRKGVDFQKGKMYESQALAFLTEEQESRNNFDLVKNTEIQSTLNISHNNADSIIVSDVYDDACAVFGMVGRNKIFDAITEAREMLANKGHWDAQIGYVDLLTSNSQYVTLPRYVDTIMALNIGGEPKKMRNQWYEFHLNGMGSNGTSCKHWDYIGEVVTKAAINVPMQFTAVPESPIDDGKKITVYGWDTNGKYQAVDYLLDHLNPLPDPEKPFFTRIERITREATQGFAGLYGFNSDQTAAIQVGYYFPDETEPKYIRIKLPYGCAWIRIKYRIRNLKVTSLSDPLHLKSKLAVMAAFRAILALAKGEFSQAESWENKAVQFLEDEQATSNPASTWNFQFENGGSNCVVI